MGELFLAILPLIWGGYLVVLSIWIILEKRSPQATIGWLLILAWFPVVGWLIYHLLGPRKLKRHVLVRVQSRDVVTGGRTYLQEQLAQAMQFYPEVELDEHGLYDIAKRLNFGDIAGGVSPYDSTAFTCRRIPEIELPSYTSSTGNVNRVDAVTDKGRDGERGDADFPVLISSEAYQISRVIYESTGLPITVASRYELLEGGGETFDALFDAIRQAKHTIHLEYYIFRPDATGTLLRDLLTEKVREGVKVRLLLDWLGSRKITHHYMADFLKAGGELAFFHKGWVFQFQSLLNMRLHRKIVVCDGRVGFTGGVNILDQQDERRVENANHDIHCRMEGPVAYWLDEVFLEDWFYITGEIPHDIPPPVPLEEIPLDQMKQVQVIAAGPDTPDAPLWRAKLMAINAARQRVWLVTPYFVPDEPAVYALTTAALRGVDVRVMLPLRSNHLITDLAARSWFKELMQAGVKIWAYDPQRMIHAKSLLVDECYSFVGTDNFDNRSFRLNFEVAILNYERSGAVALARQFEEDMKNAVLLELSDLNTKWWRRLPEDVARLAAPLL